MAISGVPRTQPLFDTALRIINSRWDQWLQSIAQALNNAGIQTGVVTVRPDSAMSASVATTNIPTPPLSAGQYQVIYTMNVMTPATSSSSLTFTAGWTLNTVSHSQSGAAVTGNSTTTQQNDVFTITVDSGSQVTYEIAYASSGVTPMSYSYSVRLVSLP